MVFQHRFLFYK